MARDKSQLQNIDNSDPQNYLNGRIKDNQGGGNGTPVNERVYGDLHQTFAKLMNLAGLTYNGLPDNEQNGYQLIDAVRNLPSKNDLSYNLSVSGTTLTLPLRVGKLEVNEVFTVKATFDKSTQTTIKGTLDNVSKTVSYIGGFKDGDYLRAINTTSSIVLITEVDAFNLARMVEDLGFLKKATQTQENTGTTELVATTPKTNKTVFAKRVNGTDSPGYLASTTQNGLLSKEFWDIINGIGTPALRNRGSFVLGDIRGSSLNTTFVSSGQITAKKTGTSGNGDVITITFDNAMDNTDYKILVDVQSLGSYFRDNDFEPIVFKPKTTTTGEIYIEETRSDVQNLKIHVDVIQL